MPRPMLTKYGRVVPVPEEVIPVEVTPPSPPVPAPADEAADDQVEEEEALETAPVPREVKKEEGDDLHDLFEGPSPEDDDMRFDDLLAMDPDQDVMGGDIGDLLDVSEEDIMGEKPLEPRPRRLARAPKRSAHTYAPPTNLGGVGG